MDLKRCNVIVIGVGQSALYMHPPAGCRPQSTGTLLQVFSDTKEVARYAVHGIDQHGVLFYVDETINANPQQYTFRVIECGRVVATGSLIVQSADKQLGSSTPTHNCCGA